MAKARESRVGVRIQRLPRWEVEIWFGGRLWFCVLCTWALISTSASLATVSWRVVTWIEEGDWRMLALTALAAMVISWIVAASCIWLTMLERAKQRMTRRDDDGVD